IGGGFGKVCVFYTNPYRSPTPDCDANGRRAWTIPRAVRIVPRHRRKAAWGRSADPTTIRLAYAQEHLPEAVKTQQVLDTARYRQVVEETGEMLPGVEVIPAQESFRVSFGKSQE